MNREVFEGIRTPSAQDLIAYSQEEKDFLKANLEKKHINYDEFMAKAKKLSPKDVGKRPVVWRKRG